MPFCATFPIYRDFPNRYKITIMTQITGDLIGNLFFIVLGVSGILIRNKIAGWANKFFAEIFQIPLPPRIEKYTNRAWYWFALLFGIIAILIVLIGGLSLVM